MTGGGMDDQAKRAADTIWTTTPMTSQRSPRIWIRSLVFNLLGNGARCYRRQFCIVTYLREWRRVSKTIL